MSEEIHRAFDNLINAMEDEDWKDGIQDIIEDIKILKRKYEEEEYA